MAYENWAVGLAVGTQTGLGVPNATIAALSGAIDTDDGILLGDRDSGDADSGLSLPSLVRQEATPADVPGSLTPQPSSFQRLSIDGFSISWLLKGSGLLRGADPPDDGEAIPIPAVRALFDMAGLIGANGTAPAYRYTPRVAASVGGYQLYGTIKLWIGNLSWVFQDCIIEKLALVMTPGGNLVATADVAVGSHDPATQFSSGVTFPTFDYTATTTGGQLHSAPLVAAVGHSWSTTRGFEDMTVTVENSASEEQDSNAETGLVQAVTERRITCVGRIYADADAASKFEMENVAGETPTADITMQIGDATTVETDPFNALAMILSDVQVAQVKPDKTGNFMVMDLSGYCTASSAGGEFSLDFN